MEYVLEYIYIDPFERGQNVITRYKSASEAESALVNLVKKGHIIYAYYTEEED